MRLPELKACAHGEDESRRLESERPRPPLAMKCTVLASLETDDGTQCVDFFARADGTFGFEQYRAEYDGPSRWQSLGKYSELTFASGQEALLAAKQHVPWLGRTEVWRW
jgi:hypothetical protein